MFATNLTGGEDGLSQGIAKFFLPKKSDANKRRAFYRKSLVLILLIASIPGLIIGLGIYWIAGGQIESELQRLHQGQIVQRAANLNDQFAYLELSLTHWAFDPKFDEKLKTLDLSYQYEQVQDLYKTLLVMQGTHPLIRQVELYLNEPRPLLFTKDGYTALTEQADIQSYTSLLDQEKAIYWTDASVDLPKDGVDSPSIALIHKIPGSSVKPFGMLIAIVDPNKAAELMKTLTPYNEGATFLLKNKTDFLLTADGGEQPSILDAALQAEVKKRDGDSGAFLFDWKRMTYSVSYGRMTRLGVPWTYVSAAPVSAIMTPVMLLSKSILLFSLGALLLAAILSWFASRRLYSPIDRLVRVLLGKEALPPEAREDEFELIERQWHHLTRESQTLQSKLERELPHLKEGFLLQLVQGYLYSLNERDLRERMKRYDWEVDDCKFLALIVQLTGFSSLEGRFSPGDEDLVTFAAANIAEELVRNRDLQYGIVNFHDLSIGLLIADASGIGADALRTEMRALSEALTQTIHSILKMKVTVAISTPARSVKDIPFLFDEARQALGYRNLEDPSQVIEMEELQQAMQLHDFSYPFALEKEIIHAIRMGLEQEADALIARFLKQLSTNRAKEWFVQQGMLQLLGSIQHAILQAGVNSYELYEGANLYDQLAQLKEPDKILAWFRGKVVQPFVKGLAATQSLHMQQTVEKVLVHLQEHYMTDISLDACAEFANTSPSTLSKAFKQRTGQNFIDYLTGIRLDKAKEMLRDTELRINEVAERVGYQHSYFNRLFKRQEGITPSQYRELIARNSERSRTTNE